ncbi:hypothetical protein [Paenibacillus sp. GP183]|uniref:hypothetical protein n=1 Tax=Paenibacillus sp. GP183 TaxID=1882751 RepID=UPI0008988F38|nr:hypothetical protein [Paenibacillus sp. GP183]SED17981.1 hypothetical protein SAMN05443246_5972 [Paenibacillus sp. GP183]
MARQTYSPGYISPQDAIQKLKNAGFLDKVTYPDQALRKLLKENSIDGSAPPKDRPQLGWEVNESSLDEYIRLQKMAPEELRTALRVAKDSHKLLQEATDRLEKLEKENRSLQRKLAKYEPEEKNPRGRKKANSSTEQQKVDAEQPPAEEKDENQLEIKLETGTESQE